MIDYATARQQVHEIKARHTVIVVAQFKLAYERIVLGFGWLRGTVEDFDRKQIKGRTLYRMEKRGKESEKFRVTVRL